MSCMKDLIDLYEKDGLEKCLSLVSAELGQCIDYRDGVSPNQTKRLITSLVAKYKNLCKNLQSAAAERELDSFLSNPLSTTFKDMASRSTTAMEEANKVEGAPQQGKIPMTIKPIGFMESVFHHKNGTPRQSGICKSAMGKLTIMKSVFNNPEHSLIDFQQFSHAWVIFWFHQNGNVHTKAKVKPPRLDGKTTGVFSTRSPYRPNPIGLTLAKIESIKGDSVYLSGIDIVDGTPILDIKPFIATYDQPSLAYAVPNEPVVPEFSNEENSQPNACKGIPPEHVSEEYLQQPIEHESKTADWISAPPVKELHVRFTENAQAQLAKFSSSSTNHAFKLDHFVDAQCLQQAIIDILKSDPRSTYRRKRCNDKLYFFTVDKVHVTCWFDDSCAEVVRIKPTLGLDTDNAACSANIFDQ